MSHYEYEVTFKELYRLIVYKKVCPFCQSKLRRINEDVLIKKGWFETEYVDTMYTYGKIFRRKIHYCCDVCDKYIELRQLKKKRWE